MLRAVFLSDLHLTSLDDSRGGKFLALLRGLSGSGTGAVSHLFLVGDIFDLWLADHQFFVQKYGAVIDQIHRLQSEGVEVHYFEGNHDLYLESYWARALGVRVHSGPAHFGLGQWQVRVEHGDQTDPDDRGYQFLRWFLRTPVMRWLAHNLPGRVVQWIGERASRSSRQYTSTVKTVTDEKAIAKLRLHAERAAANEDFDLLINGHVHVRDDYSFLAGGKSRRAMNLGSWLTEPYRYLEVSDKITWREI
jgi:UDP-2,3-diacylglucosamine hydrolase